MPRVAKEKTSGSKRPLTGKKPAPMKIFLLPCPFCLPDALGIGPIVTLQHEVKCQTCQTTTRVFRSAAEAAEFWNTRLRCDHSW